jgi:hypothetical protein
VRGHAFISYSHSHDRRYADALAAHLVKAGVPVWYDQEIVSGDRWDQLIRDQIASCAVMIVVMSPGSDASRWVKLELNEAERLRKPVAPLLLAGSRFFRLSDIQYEDVSEDRLPSSAFVARMRELTGAAPRVDPSPSVFRPAVAQQSSSGRAPRVMSTHQPVVPSSAGSTVSLPGRLAAKLEPGELPVFVTHPNTATRRALFVLVGVFSLAGIIGVPALALGSSESNIDVDWWLSILTPLGLISTFGATMLPAVYAVTNRRVIWLSQWIMFSRRHRDINRIRVEASPDVAQRRGHAAVVVNARRSFPLQFINVPDPYRFQAVIQAQIANVA